MIPIVKDIRAAAGATPILVHANAGLPKTINGVDVFPEGPAEMAARVKAIVEAGANIVVEVESGGPGLTGELTAQLAAGSYITACKPGGTGNRIRGTLTVTSGSTTSPSNGAHLATAVADCKAMVATEAAALLTRTTTFVTAVKRGDVAAAKAAYPSARVHWERIEPVAESFGDLDPKMDARENDVEPATGSSPGHLADHPLRDAGGRAGHVQQRRGLCPVFRAEQSAGQELVRPGGLVVRTAVQADRRRGRIAPMGVSRRSFLGLAAAGAVTGVLAGLLSVLAGAMGRRTRRHRSLQSSPSTGCTRRASSPRLRTAFSSLRST